MPTEKRYPPPSDRELIGKLACLIPVVIAFFFARNHFEEQDVVFWISAAFFICCLIFGIVWGYLDFKRCRCPKCGWMIRASRRDPMELGKPYRYFCKECDIVWLRNAGTYDF